MPSIKPSATTRPTRLRCCAPKFHGRATVAFLESVRDLFRAILRPEDEQQVIARLMAVARDEREAMMYRLQLASFLRTSRPGRRRDRAHDKLVADYPTNVGVVERVRAVLLASRSVDKSLDLYKRTLARSLGTNRRSFTLPAGAQTTRREQARRCGGDVARVLQ